DAVGCAGTPSTAGVRPHETPAWWPTWDSLAAIKRLVSPNPRARPPAAPPPRLWSVPLGPQGPACAAVLSVSPWPGAGATGPPPPPSGPRRDAAHSLPPAPGHTAAAASRPVARAPPRGAPAPPARSLGHPAAAAACRAGRPATAPRPPATSAPSGGPGARTDPPVYCVTYPRGGRPPGPG